MKQMELLDLKRIIGPPMIKVVAQAAYNKREAFELAEYLPPLRLLQTSNFLRSLKSMNQNRVTLQKIFFLVGYSGILQNKLLFQVFYESKKQRQLNIFTYTYYNQ